MKVNFVPHFVEGTTEHNGWWVVVEIGGSKNKTWFSGPRIVKFDMQYLNDRGLRIIDTEEKLNQFNELYNKKLRGILKNKMKPIVAYECPHCKEILKTPHLHDCKKDPEKKNCFSCKWLRGWVEGEIIDVGFGPKNGPREPSYPDCKCPNEYDDMTDLEILKSVGYDLQCEGWEQGYYYSKENIAEMKGKGVDTLPF